MTVQEVIRTLETAGWQTTRDNDELHKLHCVDKVEFVTIAGKLELSMPPGVRCTLWRLAQIDEAD